MLSVIPPPSLHLRLYLQLPLCLCLELGLLSSPGAMLRPRAHVASAVPGTLLAVKNLNDFNSDNFCLTVV
jgi:hypothetical protein